MVEEGSSPRQSARKPSSNNSNNSSSRGSAEKKCQSSASRSEQAAATLAEEAELAAQLKRIAPNRSKGRSMHRKRPKIPKLPPRVLSNQNSGRSGYALPSTYRTPKKREQPPRRTAEQQQRQRQQQDDRSVGTMKTTYTQTSRVSNVSINTPNPILDEDDPFLMDIQQKIKKSQRPPKVIMQKNYQNEQIAGDLLVFESHENNVEEQKPPAQIDYKHQEMAESSSMHQKSHSLSGYLSSPSLQDGTTAVTAADELSSPSGNEWIDPLSLLEDNQHADNNNDNDNDNKTSNPIDIRKRQHRLLLVGICLLIAVAAVVAVLVVLFIPTITGSSSPAITTTPVSSSPSSSPTTQEDFVRATIVNILQIGNNPIPNYQPPTQTLDWLVDYYVVTVAPPASENDDLLLQTATLVSLYYSLEGGNWTTNDSWLSSQDAVCDWNGIICNDVGEVTGLDLHENELAGSLPLELGLLTKLGMSYFELN